MIYKYLNKRAATGYSQILILVLSMFAFSYVIYSSQNVDAAEPGYGCCEKTNEGHLCQYVEEGDCSGKWVRSECDKTDYCRTGCCISQKTGLCNKNVPKLECEESFDNDVSCNIAECESVCCILGEESMWTTERNCQVEANFLGIPPEFDLNTKSEVECILLTEGDEKGACILEGEKCVYTTLEDCISRTGSETRFHKTFCSDPELNTSCKSHEGGKGCVEEDVYWFDSCGNPEEIAEDCDFMKGSYCKDTVMGANCESIDCKIDEKSRKNGESWCEYDDVIGHGTDPVGSRHIRHICIMGEEKIEPCSDYRNEICVEEVSQTDSGKISQSACRVNNWAECLNYNNQDSEEKLKEKCETNPDCYLKTIDARGGSGNFQLTACLPNYPPGFDLIKELDEEDIAKTESDSDELNSLCDVASQRCTEVWKWSLFTGWKCKYNCGCHSEQFTKEMNEFCVSLGDCGGYINYNGDVDQAYQIKSTWERAMPPRLSDEDIMKIKSNAINPPAEPGSDAFFEDMNSANLITILPKISGALGSALLTQILSDNNFTRAVRSTSPGKVDFSRYTKEFNLLRTASEASKFAKKDNTGSIIGAVIGGAIGFMIGVLLQVSMMMSMVFALIGGVIGFFIGMTKTKIVHIDFNCLQWNPPAEGDCNKCNEDIFCSEYRCESLGQLCSVVNEGTAAEMCTKKEVNVSIAIIEPWEFEGDGLKIPTEGIVYSEVSKKGFRVSSEEGNGCIEPYTKIEYGIKILTKEGESQYAQCKIDTSAQNNYDEMQGYFSEDYPTAYLPFHKTSFFFPSPEALKNQYNLSDEQIKNLSEMKFYVRCKNIKGIVNPEPFEIKTCVNKGPDLTAPRIQKTFPENGAYIEFGKTNQDIVVYVNEPAQCRWSTSSGKMFSEMENEMKCNTGVFNFTRYGLPCTTTLSGINSSNNFYFKCRDISENLNTMSEDYVYSLKVSQSELSITDISPKNNEEIISGFEPTTVNLKLITSGGAENGESECSYKFSNQEEYIKFFNTDSSYHEQELSSMIGGSYEVEFKCTDSAGNIAQNTSSFKIRIDDIGPIITRIYYDSGLKVVTAEKSECRYNFNRNFIYENASVMESDEEGKEHRAPWESANYYIQCMDKYGNKGGKFKAIAYGLYF
jgi:NOL1/NOP2/fmu family ribosome biogenesis protein